MIKETLVAERRLGRLPAKASRKALQFADFFKYVQLPKKTNFWARRTPVPVRTFGNTQWGNCTRAKQAVAAMRMERLEQKRTIEITDEEVIRVYREMCVRVYGSDADEGAFEDDALDAWRRPEYTFKDTKGNVYTIDAYLRINPFNHDELRAGLALSGARGIPVCLNLPHAFSALSPPQDWAIPDGQAPIGAWQPGSWGGHSMWAHDYDDIGIWLDHTWGLHPQRLTWEAAAIYLDEAHLVIDSIDHWRKPSKVGKLNVKHVIEAVNDVSSHQIEKTS